MTRENGDSYWGIQKLFKSRLTGRSTWKYYQGECSFTRNPFWAELCFSENDAEEKILELIKYDGRKITAITPIKEIDVDEVGNVYINTPKQGR